MANSRFGRLAIIGQAFKVRGKWFFVCVCDCGMIRNVRKDHLLSGATKSCGCWNNEARVVNNTTHGHRLGGITSAEYRAWCNMNDRCYRIANSGYKDYGGRGIRVCDEWRFDFAAFLAHIGPKPSPNVSIDRIDNDGDYKPGNVRWADRKTQARNTRNKAIISANGLSLTLAEWAERSGIKKGTIWHRIRVGRWSAEQAVTP